MSFHRFAFAVLLAAFAALPQAASARSIFEFFGAERTVDQAEARAREGDYDAAADLFLRASEKANEAQRPALLLRAAECAVLAQRPEMASGVLQRLDASKLSADQQLRHTLVRAELNQFLDRPQELLRALPAPGLRTPLWLAARVWKIRADALFQMGDVPGGVQALVQRELGLLDDNAVAENHDLIWRALSQSLPTLDRKRKWEGYDAITRGWLELAEIMNTYWLGPEELSRATADWQRRHPAHPANQTVLAHKPRRGAPPSAEAGARKPLGLRRAPDGKVDTLALLLPLTGPLAAPAQAVRDGFMAAYFGKSGARPSLLVFDTGTQAADIPRVTEQALSAGADVLVGPLAKDQVAALAELEPGAPVLALNYLDNFLATEQVAVPEDFFQLGLLPEDEAQQVAQRATRDGRRRALALVPEGEWGQRLLAAFRDSLQAFGGELVDFEIYPAKAKEYSGVITRLLKFNAKAAKAQDLAREQAAKGQKTDLAALPLAIRNDADFIFLVAQPPQARLLRPQLSYYRATEMPIYATSHVYSGRPAPAADQDMNGLMFCDMPWVLGGDPRLEAAQAEVEHLWPNQAGVLPRLFALGYDAFNLADGFRVGNLRADAPIASATGLLQLRAGGRINRSLNWAEFRGGRAKSLRALNDDDDNDDED